MFKQDINYQHQSTQCIGHMVYDDSHSQVRPAVLISHDWTGRNAFAIECAQKMANFGYVGFAMDNYGDAQLGQTKEEKSALIQPFLEDRALLQARLHAALNHVRAHDKVDNNKIAIIGFCFGGLCALDLARTGADIAGAVSVHGLFNPPENLPNPKITSRILALHGYDDPMAPPEAVQQLADELTQAGADWQIHMYGNTLHAFTNPEANDADFGTVYHPVACARAWQSIENFLGEIF